MKRANPLLHGHVRTIFEAVHHRSLHGLSLSFLTADAFAYHPRTLALLHALTDRMVCDDVVGFEQLGVIDVRAPSLRAAHTHVRTHGTRTSYGVDGANTRISVSGAAGKGYVFKGARTQLNRQA